MGRMMLLLLVVAPMILISQASTFQKVSTLVMNYIRIDGHVQETKD